MLTVSFPLSANHGPSPDGAAALSPTIDDSDPGVELARRGQTAEAERHFRGRIERAPQDAAGHHNFAVFLSENKRLGEAVEHYQQALRLRPRYPEAMRNLALLYSSVRQYEEALAHLWTAVSIQPQDVQTLMALGAALMSARRSEGAIPVFRQACRIAPTMPIHWNQLGLACFDCGRFSDAETAFMRCLELDPKLVSAHNNLGSLYKAMGRTQEAFSCFELALTLDPGSQKTRWNRALTLLASGQMERGWEEYECRWRSPETPPRQLGRPAWNGESLVGRTILLHAEQGLGDSIQFLRYAALLKEKGAKVVFECPSPLAEVCRDGAGVDQVVLQGESLPAFDYHAPLMGLPRLFKTTVSTVPATIPYLRVDTKRVEAWGKKLRMTVGTEQSLVGIAWQGNPHHQWDQFRSVPLMQFEPLAHVSGVRLVSLQRGPGIEQIESFNRLTGGKLLVPTDGQQTTPGHLADNAAIMMNLDLIISVDTATAHLAGALGRNVWTMLSLVADWRWMNDRHDSPWYPTMRLFRQRSMGNWPEVMANISSAMRQVKSG